MSRTLVVTIISILTAVPAMAQQPQYWYYCGSAGKYYPYVQTCPESWQRVATPQTKEIEEDRNACQSEYEAQVRHNEMIAPGVLQPMTMPDQEWNACLARQRQQREQDAAHQAEQQKAQAAQKAALENSIAKQTAADEARGYKHISFDDFALDGKTLAANDAKISITGRYVKFGNVEYLTPSPMASARLNSLGDPGESIGLLTEQADRSTRKYFLECQKSNQTLALGCGVTLLGHVTTCVKTIFLNATDVPCLEVESGWWLSSN